jgi:hypothetical protein
MKTLPKPTARQGAKIQVPSTWPQGYCSRMGSTVPEIDARTRLRLTLRFGSAARAGPR